jgi:hypothetical protein
VNSEEGETTCLSGKFLCVAQELVIIVHLEYVCVIKTDVMIIV